MLSINLSRYPLFSRLPDPEGYILAILDQQHAVFKAQDKSLLSYTSSEVFSLVEETCNKRLETVLTSLKDTCSRKLDPLLDNLKDSTDGLVEYKNKLPCLEKSVERGKVGEKVLDEFLTSRLSPNDYDIRLVSKTNHTGDIIVSKKNLEIMIDAKYYASTVPTKDFEKLKNDMNAKNIRCGILVSYSTKIAKFSTTDMSLFTNEEGTLCCVIILGKAEQAPEAIVQAIYYMEVIFNQILTKTKDIEVLADSRFGEILKSYSGVYGLLRTFDSHKRTMIDSISVFERQLNEQVITMKSLLESKIS